MKKRFTKNAFLILSGALCACGFFLLGVSVFSGNESTLPLCGALACLLLSNLCTFTRSRCQ